MLKFLKMTLAATVGFFIAATIMLFLTLGIIGAVAAAGSSPVVMPSKAILTIDLSRLTISEQGRELDPISALQGNSMVNMGLWKAVRAIDIAATDPAVKFIFLKPDGNVGDAATVEELRNALEKFRTNGKAVIAYTETPDNASYYLASAADRIFMADYDGGMNMLGGFSTQIVFLKDILDKVGVNIQLIRHGQYKSAGETYIQNNISPANREQNQVLINSMWDAWASKMAAARGMRTEDFNNLIDNLKLNSAEDFLNYGLVDELMTREALRERMDNLFGQKISKSDYISLNDYASLKLLPDFKAKDKIAIIYANGQIMDMEMPDMVIGDKMAETIAKVRADSSVKAVVFRVNSPGGSVTASDKIRTEIDLLRKRVPVIASYGAYAASGGYWISSSCDYIFADESTLTGSIGVFSMIPDLSGSAKKLGVNIVAINSNRHSDMYNGMRALDAQETAYCQEAVEDIYDAFTAVVAEGRNMSREDVDAIAQGRVWAGRDALKIGLVDSIGGLEDAVQMAKNYATGSDSPGRDQYDIVEYPKPLSAMEQLLEMFGGQQTLVFEGTPFESVEKAFTGREYSRTGEVFARLPYEIVIR